MSVQHLFINALANTSYANDNDFCQTIAKVKIQIRPRSPQFNKSQPRIDPSNLPYCNDAMDIGPNNVVRYLDQDRVILRKPALDGNGSSVNMPIDSYSMVAVRILSSAQASDRASDQSSNQASSQSDQRIFARLELIHPDPSLNIILAEAECPEHLAEDWSHWNDLTDLPLRLIDLDERIVTPPGAEDVQTSKPLPRRFGSPLQNRRTRFQTNRKIGQVVSNIVAFSPQTEIIART